MENRLTKDGEKNRVVEGDEGKEALGIYRALKPAGNYTLVEAELITGRTHQIRQQLASIGHPVVGDRKYGRPSRAFEDLHHQLLHAYKLVFPETDEFPDVSGQVFVSEPKGKFQRIRECLHL